MPIILPNSGIKRTTRKIPLTDLSGVQRSAKTGWLGCADGVTRKIFSAAFCSVAMTQTWLTSALTVGNDGGLTVQVTNNTSDSATGSLSNKIHLDFVFADAITLTDRAELFRLVNVGCSLSSGYAGAPLRVGWDFKVTGSAFSGVENNYEGTGIAVNTTTSLLTYAYGQGDNLNVIALRLAIIFYRTQINQGGTLSISIPAGGLYITGQQVNGFLQ